jgi:hypothetical protein
LCVPEVLEVGCLCAGQAGIIQLQSIRFLHKLDPLVSP